MPDLAWMAWTPETAVFFAAIALLLVLMILWGRLDPRNAPRKGILGIATQRGDRLFLSLLSAAFIHLAWIQRFSDGLQDGTSGFKYNSIAVRPVRAF